MALKVGTISELQATDFTLKTDNLTLAFDFTTQEGIHVNASHITGNNTCIVLSVEQLPGGTADDYAQCVIQAVDHPVRFIPCSMTCHSVIVANALFCIKHVPWLIVLLLTMLLPVMSIKLLIRILWKRITIPSLWISFLGNVKVRWNPLGMNIASKVNCLGLAVELRRLCLASIKWGTKMGRAILMAWGFFWRISIWGKDWSHVTMAIESIAYVVPPCTHVLGPLWWHFVVFQWQMFEHFTVETQPLGRLSKSP